MRTLPEPHPRCGRGLPAGRGRRPDRSRGGHTSVPTGTHTSLGQALLRFPGSLKRTSPCHAFPENATAGRTAPRVSPPPAGQDPPASGLLPGLFLRGGARSRPDPSRLVLRFRGLALLGHIRRRCGASGKERSRSQPGPGGRTPRSRPVLQSPKGAPTSPTCLSG